MMDDGCISSTAVFACVKVLYPVCFCFRVSFVIPWTILALTLSLSPDTLAPHIPPIMGAVWAGWSRITWTWQVEEKRLQPQTEIKYRGGDQNAKILWSLRTIYLPQRLNWENLAQLQLPWNENRGNKIFLFVAINKAKYFRLLQSKLRELFRDRLNRNETNLKEKDEDWDDWDDWDGSSQAALY